MSVKEIERAISELDTRELIELASWFQEHHHAAWDQQIADDLDAGRFDALIAELDAEYEAGLAEPL